MSDYLRSTRGAPILSNTIGENFLVGVGNMVTKDISTEHLESVTLPYEPTLSRAVYHLYVINNSHREGCKRHLASQDIGDRNPLSDSAAPAEGVSQLRIPGWRFSGSPRA
jgi:hypothetical protein